MALNQLLNSADILDHALDAAGENTDGTSEMENQALSFLNEGYQALVDGGSIFGIVFDQEWLWLQKTPPGIITLQPKILTSATVDNGSQSITFESAPSASVDAAVKTWFYKSDVESDIYRIATHDAAATAASLDSIYTGDTISGDAGKLFKLEYDLPSDFLRFYAPIRVQRAGQKEITVGTEEALDRDYPILNVQAGVPTRAAFADNDTIRFNRYMNSDMARLELPYILDPPSLANDTVAPLMPEAHFPFLVYYIAHFLSLLKEDFDKATRMEAQAAASLVKMALANRKRMTSGTRSQGKIYARRGDLKRNEEPLKTEQGFIISR